MIDSTLNIIPRPRGILIQDEKLKCLQVVPGVGQMWADMWYWWDWEGLIKSQVDKAAELGANCIKISGPGPIFISGARYNSEWNIHIVSGRMHQFIDYCSSLGLKTYWNLAQYQEFGSSDSNAIGEGMAKAARLLDPYDSVIGIDIINESNLGAPDTATAQAWISYWTPYVRSATTLPVTHSMWGNTPDMWSHSFYTQIAPFVDFYDFHPYYTTGHPSASDLAKWRKDSAYKGKFIIGECGLGLNEGNVEHRWEALGRLLKEPDIPCVVGFCIQDYDDNLYGLYDKNLKNERGAAQVFRNW